MSDGGVLHVLFAKNEWNGNDGDAVLSFLPPADEQGLPVTVISARVVVNSIREDALSAYLNLVAAVGATRCGGETLREVLEVAGQGNAWWYHQFSGKNVEDDPTFDRLLKVMAILKSAKEAGISRITLYGAERAVAQTLASSGIPVKSIHGRGAFCWKMVRAFASRAEYFVTAMVDLGVVRYYTKQSSIKPDVVLQGFWDWSIRMVDGRVQDKYFGDLPTELNKRGIRHAWFLWYSNTECSSLKKSICFWAHKSGLAPLSQDETLIIIQRFLSVSDIFKVVLNIRPLYSFAWFSHRKGFRQIFHQNGIDLWPLVSDVLWTNFCNSLLPLHFLVEIASRRAAAFYQPKASLNFLELFLHSRAFYQGTVKLNPSMIRCAVQHASYNYEKTFLRLEPQREMLGFPDGLAAPVPDIFYCMGTLGKDILLGNGFSTERLVLTGSPRYDSMNFDRIEKKSSKKDGLSILIVSTLHENIDMEMIQAVTLATAKFENVKLYLRSHPFNRLEHKPAFGLYQNLITSVSGSLTENLKLADIVFFSYSTVAEEAYIRGVPIVQWLSARFNGSVFRDVQASKVRSACTVEELTLTIEDFLRSPQDFYPTDEEQEAIANRCFYKTDGRAAVRIAEHLKQEVFLHSERIGAKNSP